jgi:hypothetical protein
LPGSSVSNAPTTSLTKPDSDFSLTFDLDSFPSPYASLSNQFGVLPASLIYTFGGQTATLSATIATTASFFTGPNPGGISFVLTDPAFDQLALYFKGPQIFTGPTSAPNLLPETYMPAPSATQWVLFQNHTQVANGNIAMAIITNAPEPSSFALLGAGIGLAVLSFIPLTNVRGSSARF